MSNVTRGFFGQTRGPTAPAGRVPPGQYLTDDFPGALRRPHPAHRARRLASLGASARSIAPLSWSWDELLALPQEEFTVDIHCVTKWSKLDTTWRGVSVDTLLADVDTAAEYVMARSYGGYTTNLPLADVLDGKAWVVHTYDGEPLDPEHGGPARLLVPHLYFWKSAKWVWELELMNEDELGFWEGYGYHAYGDPWQEQRYAGD